MRGVVDEGQSIYDAVAHGELSPDGGRTLVISYSRATGFLQSEMCRARVTLR